MPSNELEVAKPFEIVITNEQKELVRRTIAPDATDAELQLFFYDCTRRGVHPLDKLIHFTKRSGKYTPITSIDMFRMRAAESGEHMGTDDAVYTGDAGKPEFAASVTVYRRSQGEKCSYAATARWSEYFPGEAQGFMWKKMPHLMLAKCAEALALRKAFPQQLHGLYTPEEMAQAERPSIPQTRPRNDATMVQPADEERDSLLTDIPTPPSFHQPYRMKSGKHAGKSITEVPRDFLEWARANADGALRKIANEELTRRSMPINKPLPTKPEQTPEQYVATAYKRINDCTTTDKLDETIDVIYSELMENNIPQNMLDECKRVYENKRAKLK